MSPSINSPLPQRTEICEREEINLEMDESNRMGPKSAALKTRPVAYVRNVLEDLPGENFTGRSFALQDYFKGR